MAQITDPKSALVRVITALHAAPGEVLLVGGIVPLFLITDPGSAAPRQTDDVDIVADIESRAGFSDWEDRLRNLGFVNDRSAGAPICRWRLDDLIVDFMPTNPAILGFANQWYRDALHHGAQVEIAPGIGMRIITAPYFLATKLEAFHDRGRRDYIASKDMTDILVLVDGRMELLDEIREAETSVKEYIAVEFAQLLSDEDFLDSVSAHLLPDAGSQARRPMILDRMRAIAALAR